ncbi:hypothetical protein [Anaeromyxobacter oryzae]|nr:hypothetical protein [Anaeromyxobacter oryzae]
MTTYESGATVNGGFYFNPSRWTIDAVAHDGARLPNAPGRWLRVPAAMALVLTPILGATFLVFLPLVGFVLAARSLASVGVRMLGGPATELAATMSPGLPLGEAHFTGRAGSEGGAGSEVDARLDALEREIADRRRAAASE